MSHELHDEVEELEQRARDLESERDTLRNAIDEALAILRDVALTHGRRVGQAIDVLEGV